MSSGMEDTNLNNRWRSNQLMGPSTTTLFAPSVVGTSRDASNLLPSPDPQAPMSSFSLGSFPDVYQLGGGEGTYGQQQQQQQQHQQAPPPPPPPPPGNHQQQHHQQPPHHQQQQPTGQFSHSGWNDGRADMGFNQGLQPFSYPANATDQRYASNQDLQGTNSLPSFHAVSQPSYSQGEFLDSAFRQPIVPSSHAYPTPSSASSMGSRATQITSSRSSMQHRIGSFSMSSAMASHETSPEVPPRKPDTLDVYESSMRDAFQAAHVDDIKSAGEHLLHATHRLLRNTTELSLYQENIDGHEPRSNWRSKRRDVWKTFNNAWLAILLRQTDLSKEELRSGRKLPRPASRISRNFLERMGNELTSLQDDIKSQGLSDYGELGVWDGQIKDQLLKCREIVLRLDGPFSPDIVIEDLRAKPDRR